ncbi:MAG: hypothetical protein Q4F71_06395 [Paracoccus sp. (in: a-proteobacteria)]|nr:hypothetical protein [Paracoccus sp. (in: a-proteobacteria)]
MKYKTAAAAICAMLPLGAPEARADAVCVLNSHLMWQAVGLREQGYSQQQTAQTLAARIADAASNGPGPLAERQHIARSIGEAATEILTYAYTIQLRPGRDNASIAADVIYLMCMGGDL